MIKRVDAVKNCDYKINFGKKTVFDTNSQDTFEFATKNIPSPNYSFLSKLKSFLTAITIGLSTQNCSDDSPVDDMDNSQSELVLEFDDALEKLRDDAYSLSVPEIVEKLDSTVYANKDKIDDFAAKSDKNYQLTSDFVNTVLSAFGSENSQHSDLYSKFENIALTNDGLLNQDYVDRINLLYQQLNNKMAENPTYFEKSGYLEEISNKQDDLNTNCKVANTVRQNAIKKLKNDAMDFNEKEPFIDSDEYKFAYEKYIEQADALLKLKFLNTKEANDSILELIESYNALNKIADSYGKERIYEAGLKMLNASHTMVDAASRGLIDSLGAAISDDSKSFSDSFMLIHYNLDKIINKDDYESPIVDKIIDGLNF